MPRHNYKHPDSPIRSICCWGQDTKAASVAGSHTSNTFITNRQLGIVLSKEREEIGYRDFPLVFLSFCLFTGIQAEALRLEHNVCVVCASITLRPIPSLQPPLAVSILSLLYPPLSHPSPLSPITSLLLSFHTITFPSPLALLSALHPFSRGRGL